MMVDESNINEVAKEAQIKLVTTLLDLRMFDESETILEKLRDEDEEDVQCWYLLSLLYVCRGDSELAEDALSAVEELCKKYPQNLEFWSENIDSLKLRLK